MVDEEIAAAGVKNERVLRAMRDTPRHEFVPLNQRRLRLLRHGPADRRRADHLAAVRRRLHDASRSIRSRPTACSRSAPAAATRRPSSARWSKTSTRSRSSSRSASAPRARSRSSATRTCHAKVGDGYQGWPEAAPFDKIIVTCSPEKVPQPLVDQLREGGRMIVPVGERYQQNLYLFRKNGDELETEALKATLFVPMTGEAEDAARSAARSARIHKSPTAASKKCSIDADERDSRARRLALPAPTHTRKRSGQRPDGRQLRHLQERRTRPRRPRPARLRHRRPQDLEAASSTTRSAARTSAPAASRTNGR